ncbi:calcium-binding protein [Candidatus Dojkabacteria bacterium]|uniref:Calcium-binding protein n=1 Tax=Candidatus Dojkabacteria bacterium TaxID=2099670 RepID=A0A955RGI8_9BACT|nr:calcium-binding protein [Candidatus Dojkabacteria bacterium]
MDLEEDKSYLPMIIGLVFVGALVIGGGVLLTKQNNETATTTDTTTNTTAQTQETTTQEPPTNTQQEVEIVYTDGTYSSTGSYLSPAGSEEVLVTVTLENDVITDVNVEPQATNPTSVFMQNNFADGIKDVIVGKNIDDVEYPGNINGSSLTGKGFIDAIELIKADALV